jgi:hypothetical protein
MKQINSRQTIHDRMFTEKQRNLFSKYNFMSTRNTGSINCEVVSISGLMFLADLR